MLDRYRETTGIAQGLSALQVSIVTRCLIDLTCRTPLLTLCILLTMKRVNLCLLFRN